MKKALLYGLTLALALTLIVCGHNKPDQQTTDPNPAATSNQAVVSTPEPEPEPAAQEPTKPEPTQEPAKTEPTPEPVKTEPTEPASADQSSGSTQQSTQQQSQGNQGSQQSQQQTPPGPSDDGMSSFDWAQSLLLNKKE